MIVKLNNKKLNLNVRKVDFFSKFIGLMFKSKEEAIILLFENVKNKSIHSFFVFFPFLCLWMDKENNILEWKIIKPFSPYEKSNTPFVKIIEVPLSRRYHYIVSFVVGERFKKTSRL